MEALLKKLYYDPAHGFKSLIPLYQMAHAKDESITKDQVADFLKNQEGYQLTRKSGVTKSHYHHIIGPLGSWQIDLMFYEQYESINLGFGIFFVAIEINTRFLIVIPLKSKNQYDVLSAFSEFYTDSPDSIAPQNILSDNGTEFKNATLQEIENQLAINHYYAEPEDHRKLGMIDRVIRTLRALIERYMASYETHRFIDALPDLVANYNTTESSATGYSPKDALDHLDDIVELQRAKAGAFKELPEFPMGQAVRVLKRRGAFEKGTTQTYSKTIHYVVSTTGTRAKLENGKSYPYDFLQKLEEDTTQQAPEKAKAHVRKEEEATIAQEKQTKKLEKEGLSTANIRAEPRIRQPKKQWAE